MCKDCGQPRHGQFPEPEIEKYPRWVRVIILLGGVAFAWAVLIGLYLVLA